MKSPQAIIPVGVQTTFVEVWKWGQELERLHARIASREMLPRSVFLLSASTPCHYSLKASSTSLATVPMD